MDIATPLGFVIGLGALLLAFLLEGGTPAMLFNVPAILVVFGGTLGIACVSFPMGTIVRLPKAILKALLPSRVDPFRTRETLVALARKARQAGALALESDAEAIGDPFLKQGVRLVVDGKDAETVRDMLELTHAQIEQRHEGLYRALEAMGGYAPTLGIIGAVLGLINALSHLSDPSELGHAIAVAFVATLYGVSSANLVWLPLATKLQLRSEEELLVRRMTIEGVLAIQAGNSARTVEEKLRGFLVRSLRELDAEPPEGEPVSVAGGRRDAV